ncbi:MAG: transglycosylase domain-containing protein [Polyangiales bacterium]
MELGPRSLVAGGLVAAGMASAAAGWFWWGPSKVIEEMEVAASERGYALVVGDVDLRWSGVDVEDVHIEGPNVNADLPSVQVHGGLWALSQLGRDAIERVEVVGGEVRYTSAAEQMPQDDDVDTADANGEPDAEAQDAEAGADTPEGADAPVGDEATQSGTAADEPRANPEVNVEPPNPASSTNRPSQSSWPALAFQQVRVAIADPIGELAEATLSGNYAAGELTVSAESSRIGEAPGNSAQVEAGELSATHQASGWVLDTAKARGVVVHLGDAELATRRRISTLLRGRDEAAAANEPEEDSTHDPLSRFSAEAEIEIESAQVVRGEDEMVLESFQAKARRGDEGISFEGHGRGAGGVATWELMLQPEVPSARGSVEVESLALDLLLPVLPELPWSHPELARVAADVEVEANADGDVALVGTVSLSDAALEHARIAPQPIQNIGFEVTGRATINALAGRVTIPEAEVRIGEATMGFQAAAEKNSEFWTLEFDARLPPTDCNDAVGAIPVDLLAETAGFSWTGRMSGDTHLKIDSRNFRELELDINLRDQCRFQTVPAAADIRRVQGAFLHRVVEPEGESFEMMAGPGTANWVPIAAISPFLIQSVIGHEDGGFFRHNGFAVYAIRDALARNLREGRYVVGASTITMQLTKNLFLHREKTLARKVQEVLLTWWVETALTKEEILELYLNVIEYGPRVYGVVQASDHYFGRHPVEITAAEAAFFATILPNPKRYHEAFEQGTLPSSMRNRVANFLRHLRSRNRIDQVALADGIAQLEVFRFDRGTGAGAQWQAAGDVGHLPFATSRAAPIEEGDPEPDPYEEEYTTGDEWL